MSDNTSKLGGIGNSEQRDQELLIDRANVLVVVNQTLRPPPSLVIAQGALLFCFILAKNPTTESMRYIEEIEEYYVFVVLWTREGFAVGKISRLIILGNAKLWQIESGALLARYRALQYLQFLPYSTLTSAPRPSLVEQFDDCYERCSPGTV